MALKYHLVLRPNLSKEAPAGSKILYGQVRAGDRISYNEVCESIAEVSTASKGDVSCVLDGFVKILRRHLIKGHVVDLADFGSFRMIAGSSGVEKEEDFHPSLFRKGKIVFTPGTVLNDLRSKLSFEKLDVKTVTEECDKNHVV